MISRPASYLATVLSILQIAVDACACLSGFVFAFWIYKDTALLQSVKRRIYVPLSEDYYLVAAAFAAIVLLCFTVNHLYQSRETGLMNMDEATRVLQGLVLSSVIVIGGSYLVVWDPSASRISRLILAFGVAFGCLLVFAGRAFVYGLRRYLQAHGHFFRRVIICGAGESGRQIARKLLHSPKFHIVPVAFLDDDAGKQNTRVDCLSGYETVPVAGTLTQLSGALEKYGAQEVWIAITNADQEAIMKIATTAGQCGVPCRFVPNLYQIPLDTISVDSVGGIPLLSIKSRATVQPMPVTKRVFDAVFSVLVLLLSAPLWPAIMLLIKATSKGPIFFAHERVGRGGAPFVMYKFRTMYVDAHAYAATPQHSADVRITPVGRWLRKFSIDELPQFWNVVKGEMSVVGPRPEMPQIVALYSSIQRQRLCMRPGITGIWQISADRKNPIHENIDYDLYYIEKQSFFLDIMIIITTGFYSARGV